MAAVSSNFWCPKDLPAGALPNGAGALCFDSAAHCLAANNNCGTPEGGPCKEDFATCATGIAAGALVPTNWFCENDVPSNGLAAGNGVYCYTDPGRRARASVTL